MFWVSVPWELTPVHLLELCDVAPLLRDQFRHCAELIAGRDLASAETVVGRLAQVTSAQRDRHAGALALLLRAELFRRQSRWEDALDAVRRALHWLEGRVSPAARYNEGIAVYLEGIVHYVLGAEEKVVATFAYAQQVLSESERYWSFGSVDGRAADCRNVISWLRRLMELRTTDVSDELALVMPCYELVNRAVVRTDAVLIRPYDITIPTEVLAEFIPSDVQPIQIDTVTIFHPHLRAQYAAVRITKDGPAFGRSGDLLVVEIVAGAPTSGELVLTTDTPFVRRADGRVEFYASSEHSGVGTRLTGPGLIGIPRVLIREGGRA